MSENKSNKCFQKKIQNIPKPVQVAHKAFSNHLVFPNTADHRSVISRGRTTNTDLGLSVQICLLWSSQVPQTTQGGNLRQMPNTVSCLLTLWSYSSEMLQLKNSLRGKKSGWEEQVVTACNGFIDWTCWLSRDLRELSSGLMRFWEDDISLSCCFKDFL